MGKIIEKIIKKVSEKKNDRAPEEKTTKIALGKKNGKAHEEKISSEDLAVKFGNLVDTLKKENQKLIPVIDFNNDLKGRVLFCFHDLENLKKEVLLKHEQIKSLSQQFDESVDSLSGLDVISINKETQEIVQSNIKKYSSNLQKLINEIETELKSLSVLSQKELPAAIAVHKDESDNFEDYILHRLKWTRRYIKKVRKDLNVSFSRFQFDLNSQIKQIQNLNLFVQAAKKHKKLKK